MTTGQMIVLGILSLLMIIGYFGTAYNESNKKLGFIILWLFSSILTMGLTIIMTSEREKALTELKGKCPEYEKIENVYRLKDIK